MSLECETEYYDDLMRKKLLLETAISQENVLEKLLDFYGRIEAIR